MRNRHFISSFAAACVCASLAFAPSSATGSDFDQGAKHVNFSLGSGRSFGDDYAIIGLGASYYVAQGLELGLGAKFWLGGDTSITELTTSATYVFTQVEAFKPYLGAIYRREYIEDFDNQSAYGGRAGFYTRYNNNAYFQLGLVAIEYTDCDDNLFRDCSDIYPEIGVGISF